MAEKKKMADLLRFFSIYVNNLTLWLFVFTFFIIIRRRAIIECALVIFYFEREQQDG